MLAQQLARIDHAPAHTRDDVSVRTRELEEHELLLGPQGSESPQIGDTIDGIYKVCGVLGSGGMGTVYLARDTQLDREVALKQIHHDKLSDPRMIRRFEAEARAMARVHHPNVATIHAFGSYRGRPYLVMERVHGHNLAVWRQQRSTVAPSMAVAVLDALCRGVQAIHEAGAVHRDLKPGNVIIGPSLRVVVTDFGLACSPAERGQGRLDASGTPAYLAPEVARRERLLPGLATRIDVYALGLIAFELLTGQPPFAGCGARALLGQHACDEPPYPSVSCPTLSPAFDAPLLHALAKAPIERTGSAEAFRRGLLDALDVSATIPRRTPVLVDEANTCSSARWCPNRSPTLTWPSQPSAAARPRRTHP